MRKNREKTSSISMITDAYNCLSTDPEFNSNQEPSKELTPIDTFFIPAQYLQTEEAFKNWFEPRFFELDDSGINHFNRRIQQAIGILDDHPYLLSPVDGRPVSVDSGIKSKVKRGFSSIDDVRKFCNSVRKGLNKKSTASFLSPPDISRPVGAKKLTTCRLLTLAYGMEYLEKSQQFRNFVDYSKAVLGIGKTLSTDSGILSGLNLQSRIDFLDTAHSSNFVEWLKEEAEFENANFNVNNKSHYIPKVQIRTKDGFRSFMKVLRKPDAEFDLFDDFLALRFILSDDASNEQILDLLHDLQEEAKRKTDPKVELEFREKNYFSAEERKKYFPEDLKKNGEGKSVRGGGKYLDRIKVDKNQNSGKGYKNMSVKVRLTHTDEEDLFFAFEVQFLRESELENNEKKPENPGHHFPLEHKQLTELMSRLNGKMIKEEIIISLETYLTEKFTVKELIKMGKITGTKRNTKNKFHLDISGKTRDIAEKLFELMERDGTLRKVKKNFPEKKKPTQHELEHSEYFIHRDIRQRILNVLGYLKK